MQLRCGVGSISWEVLGIDAVEIGFAVRCFVSSLAALDSKEGAQILYCYSYRVHFIAQLSVYNWLHQVVLNHGPKSFNGFGLVVSLYCPIKMDFKISGSKLTVGNCGLFLNGVISLFVFKRWVSSVLGAHMQTPCKGCTCKRIIIQISLYARRQANEGRCLCGVWSAINEVKL